MIKMPSNMFQFIIALIIFSFTIFSPTFSDEHEDFIQCFSIEFEKTNSTYKDLIYTQGNDNNSYTSILQFTIQNQRYNTNTTPKPLVIVTPTHASHVQATVKCSRKYGLEIRVRSNGHDYHGLSYVSPLPFVFVDMIRMSDVDVDVATKTAWIQAGATLGEVYYSIAEKSKTLAFPAGICPTVGVGGHFSGGAYGMLLRKYGLAVDNIVDAILVDVEGRVLDRSSMGEDVFWAIRGGGGNTFGIVIAWKSNLVEVPPTVTVFTIKKTLEQNATGLFHRWQYVAPELSKDLIIRVVLHHVNSSEQEGKTTVQAAFDALFLGRTNELLPLMEQSFPELGLTKEDCVEMSWIESTMYAAGFAKNTTLDALLERRWLPRRSLKGKSDYIIEPIPEFAIKGLFERLLEVETDVPELNIIPYGGRMSEIPESNVPFPHRQGNLYKINYLATWTEAGNEAIERHVNWSRRLYSYMEPYVSKNPRLAYVNYRDLDLGYNELGNTSYEQARVWGTKYFKGNFERLAQVKTKADPTNFFRNEQSVPPFSP